MSDPLTSREPTDQEVIEGERNYLAESRARQKIFDDRYAALAISGGGIRSASFGLGVMQALVRAGVMERLDYLSTASGGGYIGSSLTWFLNRGGERAGTDPDRFPFGSSKTAARVKWGSGQGHSGQAHSDEMHPNAALDFIRQRGNYLTPTPILGAVSFSAFVLRTILVSLVAYFLLGTVVLLAGIEIHAFDPMATSGWPFAQSLSKVALNPLLAVSLGLVGLFLLSSVAYSILSRLVTRSYFGRTAAQIVQGKLLQGAIGTAVLGALPIAVAWMDHLSDLRIEAEAASGLATLAGAVLAILQRRRQQSQKAASPLLGMLAAFLLIFGLMVGAYQLGRLLDSAGLVWMVLATVAAFTICLVVNTNNLSLHRGYRDRLMETFLPDPENVRLDRWGRANQADRAPIHEMCKHPHERPYHLVQTNVVLIDSPRFKFRGRGGDSFLLSPLFCGSNATGWIHTRDYMPGRGGVTLATAMAVSGAAVNPHSGNSGGGLTHNRIVSTLFSLLNIRLGYWAANPRRQVSKWLHPNFIFPGLKGGIFGGGFHENNHVIELTDGGHFDNTALYELLRRRIQLIILSDAGADGSFTFDDLGNAIERARVDFGVKIRFDDPDFSLQGVVAGSATGDDPDIERYHLARNAFAVGRIEYLDKTQGTLIYVKATLVEGLPADVYSYRGAHSEFPHEPTSDQFFNEVQFEAYRELGYQLAWKMLEANGVASQDHAWRPDPKGALAMLFADREIATEDTPVAV